MKFIALDVGEKRIGVARADSSVKIAVPNGVVFVDGGELEKLVRIINIYGADAVVIGMPRNLKGETTKQSEYVKNFAKRLNQELKTKSKRPVKILFQDESLTSVEAKQNLSRKKTPLNKKSGEVDAEAATLILQDFLENLSRRIKDSPKTALNASPNTPKTPMNNSPVKDTSETTGRPTPQFKPYKKPSVKKWLILRVVIITVLCGLVLFFSARAIYNHLTSPLTDPKVCENYNELYPEETEGYSCGLVRVSIEEGSTVSDIAEKLRSEKLIRSALAFKIYAKLNKSTSDLKSGNYEFNSYESVAEIIKKLKKGTADTGIVFRFTTLPGETISDIKKRLLEVGYSSEEIDEALTKTYDHPVLADKPADASLEGYLFGETYEFYTTDSVETIVIRMLDELYSVVQKNNLKQKFNSFGLTLHEGIILASVVQKEAGTLTKADMATVAQIFYSRLNAGDKLGSDVTVKYAVDLVDPNREVYVDNAKALTIDSCYNTRKNTGLPCGAISNPSALVLISTANPSDTSYYYFLTGDDGLMYYSSTKSEHNQNIRDHCQVLCNTQL